MILITPITVAAVLSSMISVPYAPALAASPQPFPLKSTSVELPSSDRSFPKGPGVETVSNNCVTCHSAGMILNQPALSKATWDSEVHKMISVYKAPVSPEDAAIIVDYLSMNLKNNSGRGSTGGAASGLS